jgi:hypothetical protein
MQEYYVYYHLNSKTKQLIYIGVGYHKRAWCFKWGRNKHYLNYVKKHGNPLVEIKYSNLTQDEAYELEINLIKEFGRIGIDKNGILLNKSEGGKTSAKGNKQYITQEWKDKISKSNKGLKKHNFESKDKISTKNSKSVLQLDLNGNLIKEWKSQWEASFLLKINYKSINNCVMNISKSAGNFKWKLK